MNAIFSLPAAANEPVLQYAPGSAERAALKAQIHAFKHQAVEIPLHIGGQDVFTGQTQTLRPPHELHHTLGSYHLGSPDHVRQALAAARRAKPAWAALPFEDRAAIFLKAAELAAGPWRQRLNAATLLGQSKTAYQAEIDSACELIDFLRFNVQYARQIYAEQPASAPGIWNRMDYRPLDGYVVAITPFNFTAIAANLPSAPALMGNTVVWKPAESQMYSAQVILELFRAAGLPDGVINMVVAPGPEFGEVVFRQSDFAGLHFTGSTAVFQTLWKTIGNNIRRYKAYPRIVGETGGKDFILAHASAQVDALVTAALRGAFEFQGQKCSAASRMFVPQSLAPAVIEHLVDQIQTLRQGSPEDFRNFLTAVIDRRAYDKITGYIDRARAATDCTILAGGGARSDEGYFIEPTLVQTTNLKAEVLTEEIFGPVLGLYVYPDADWSRMFRLIEQGSDYALTGAVFADDRQAIAQATAGLASAAGNFYINDKPTGAVVNQQPFGGGRASGTNDKAGSVWNLLRWVNARTLKETFVPPVRYEYPFMQEA
jgi:1-pyrroline-5-carboxylate dehydrogenase